MAGLGGGVMDPKSLSVFQRVNLLVKALNGAKRTNEALARCGDGEAMLDVLLDASAKLGLGLTRRDLQETPPIRDWIWWKNKEALLTIGDNRPRYQQDGRQGRPSRPAPTPEPPAAASRGGAPLPPGPEGGEGGEAPSGGEPPRRRFLGLF